MIRRSEVLTVAGHLIDELERRNRSALADLAASVNQLGENLVTATIAQIEDSLTHLGTTIAGEGTPLPAGFVAVAQSDLDTILGTVEAILAQLATPAPPPAPVTDAPVTDFPITVPVTVASPGAIMSSPVAPSDETPVPSTMAALKSLLGV